MSRFFYRLGWLLLIVATIGVSGYAASLRRQERELADRTASLRQAAEERRIENKRGIAAVYDAEFCLSCERSKDQKLQTMLRECTSRDDFLVREGPRIVWSELAGGSESVKSLAVYLPAGKHRLRFGPGDPADSDASDEQSPRPGGPGVGPVFGCELGPHPEVYEIQFLSGAAEGESNVVVRGSDNTIVCRGVIPGVQGSREVGLETEAAGFAYPSEVKFTEDAGRKLRLPLAPPVTELATLQTSPRWRVWIESDARPCVSAIVAAAHYDEAALLGDGGERPPKGALRRNSDDEFTRRYMPYDGSGVLYLRENMVRSQGD